MKITPNSKLLMIGDSITDCNRALPIGEAPGDGLGNGYVNLINGMLNSAIPPAKIRIVNMGVSGNTIRDLKACWETDVSGMNPDWLSILIGINDVWRHFDFPYIPDWHIARQEFETTFEELILAALPKLRGLVLMTPYFIEPNRSEPMREVMDRYGEIVMKLGQKHDAIVVDLQSAFDAVLENVHPSALAWDRIHPNLTGHMIIARVFLKAIGFE